jgi:hypothetical protein
MKGDIALVGFVLTAEEWESLDSISRAQLLAAAFQRSTPGPWVVAPLAGMLSEPIRIATDDPV